METIPFSKVRENFTRTVASVIDDRVPVRITNKRRGAVVMLPEEDFNSWRETVYLLKSPANARRLMEGIEALERGKGRTFANVEDIQNELEA